MTAKRMVGLFASAFIGATILYWSSIPKYGFWWFIFVVAWAIVTPFVLDWMGVK